MLKTVIQLHLWYLIFLLTLYLNFTQKEGINYLVLDSLSAADKGDKSQVHDITDKVIYGRVTDLNGKPVKSRVNISRISTTDKSTSVTVAQGKYSLTFPLSDNDFYVITFSSEKYLTAAKVITQKDFKNDSLLVNMQVNDLIVGQEYGLGEYTFLGQNTEKSEMAFFAVVNDLLINHANAKITVNIQVTAEEAQKWSAGDWKGGKYISLNQHRLENLKRQLVHFGIPIERISFQAKAYSQKNCFDPKKRNGSVSMIIEKL
jgi:hypothetical protein